MRSVSSMVSCVIAAGALAGLGACGSSSDGDCADDQVQVVYLGGSRDGETVCKPIPAACGATASCGVQACEAAMYDYCDSPYLGVGCSDTFPPPIISCNP
ncbi:MAG TPA: hypothetical protein VHE35_14485 [Kofleriaceae bacterium]|nr:hypothetical protein [Kofleriaceae bacterium]